MYLGGRQPTPAVLASELVFSALVSRAKRVEIRVLESQWTAVAAGSDWISPNMTGHFKDRPIEELVKLMIPWDDGGPNAIRLEVIVAAFSSNLAIKSGRRWLAVVGELPAEEVRAEMSDVGFAIVFQPIQAQSI